MATRRRTRPRAPRLYTEPEASAKAASLRYVSDRAAGIRRRRAGRGFGYLMPDGGALRDAAALARIRKLAIPPAWDDVWICLRDDGHLQATGRDARRRKQYRYHPRWREVRDETKYGRLLAFGAALPRIRERVHQDLASPALSRHHILAGIVALLEATLIRVGNDEYARDNNSFGLTTMLGRHVQVEGSEILFRFRGKSGKTHAVRLNNRRLARLVRRCRELPGQELFQYLDENGMPQTVDSSDVNEYLKEIAGDEFTSKDFRTWAGTLLAAEALPPGEECGKPEEMRAVELASRRLGNTVAVARKCYIHPAVLEAYRDPARRAAWLDALGRQPTDSDRPPAELALLAYLDRRRPVGALSPRG